METKIKQKLQQEEQKRSAAAEKKRIAALTSDATKITGKVTPIIQTLQKISSYKSFKLVPTKMQRTVELCIENLTMYQAEANSRISGNTTAFCFTIDDVNKNCKAGTRGK